MMVRNEQLFQALEPPMTTVPWKFRFTVLTATYNRAHTLNGVCESLCAQTFRDFEWLIIDDGSTDETAKLVASWKPSFALRYIQKPNGGKHTAINLGAGLAEGEWILFFDSDDRCIPSALERFDHHVSRLPDADRFANVSCLCTTPDGAIIGGRYPGGEFIDAIAFADQIRLRNSDRWSTKRTEILRKYPFPEGECFVPEGLVWNRMSRKYATRFINEPLQICERSPDSLSRRVTKLRILSPKATRLYYRELIFSPAPVMLRMKGTINYCRFGAIDIYRKLFRIKPHPSKQKKNA